MADLRFGSRRIPLPASRAARIALGGALIVGGLVGFLPILGFWMLPLGLLVLSVDLAIVRRQRRRTAVWWARRQQARAAARAAAAAGAASPAGPTAAPTGPAPTGPAAVPAPSDPATARPD
jgi:purine-cytosine permease-like protein